MSDTPALQPPETSNHRRLASVKSIQSTRRPTKGPLDAPDLNDLSLKETSAASSLVSPTTANQQKPPSTPTKRKRKFAYLLRRDIYSPIAPSDVAPALRSDIPSLHPTLPASLASLEEFQSHGQFFSAAILAARILMSPLIDPGDGQIIFDLIWLRLACLEICGLTFIAAQEAKCLEDLNSAFYYDVDEVEEEEDREQGRKSMLVGDVDDVVNEAGSAKKRRKSDKKIHIVPWHLRVLALRLQSVGFNDPRRGCTGIYELGLEARRNLARDDVSVQEQKVWKERLADLGMRNVNALISMGSLDTARRALSTLHWPSESASLAAMYMAVLHIQVGDMESAHKLMEAQRIQGQDGEAVTALSMMTKGKLEEASTVWETLMDKQTDDDDDDGQRAMIAQNLALSLLYGGHLDKVNRTLPVSSCSSLAVPLLTAGSFKTRNLLESLMNKNYSSTSLLFNLATIYELCFENAQSLRASLAERNTTMASKDAGM